MADDVCCLCGHPAWYHRLDDSTNISPCEPSAQFRCIWPVLAPFVKPIPTCHCPDFCANTIRESERLGLYDL